MSVKCGFGGGGGGGAGDGGVSDFEHCNRPVADPEGSTGARPL